MTDLCQEAADLASKVGQLDVPAFHERLLLGELQLQIIDPYIETRLQLVGSVGRELESVLLFPKLAIQLANYCFNSLTNLFCLGCGKHLGLPASGLRSSYLFPKRRYF